MAVTLKTIKFVLIGISSITCTYHVAAGGTTSKTITSSSPNLTTVQSSTLTFTGYSKETGYGYPIKINPGSGAFEYIDSDGDTSTTTMTVTSTTDTVYVVATGTKVKIKLTNFSKIKLSVYLANATNFSNPTTKTYSNGSSPILYPGYNVKIIEATGSSGYYNNQGTCVFKDKTNTDSPTTLFNNTFSGEITIGKPTASEATLTCTANKIPTYDYSWQVYTYVDGKLVEGSQKDSATTTKNTYTLNLFSYITVDSNTYDYDGYSTTLTGSKVDSSSVILSPSKSVQTFYVFFTTKPTYYTVTVSLPEKGIDSYYITYTTVDNSTQTNVKAPSNNKVQVQIGSTFKIESVNYSKGYEKSGNGAGTTLKNIRENKTITLGAVPKKFELKIYHCDTDGTRLLSYATKKEYTIEDSISLDDISEDIGGWKAIGYTFDDEDFDSLSTSLFSIEESTTVYVVYNNPPISFTATKSTTKNTISISNIQNGASPYSYTVACYDTDGTFLLGGKTFTSNSTVLPYGYKYKVTIVDADGDTASSSLIEMDKFAPSISHTQADDGYTITFTANYTNSSGYTSIKFDDAETYVTNKSFSKTYDAPGEQTVSFQFRGVWSSYTNAAGQIQYTYITYTIDYSFDVKPRFQYKIKNYYYYWNTTIKDAQYLSESSTTIITNSAEFYVPSIKGYTYKSYLLTADQELDKSGTGNHFNLYSDTLNNIVLYYWKDVYPYAVTYANESTNISTDEPAYYNTIKTKSLPPVTTPDSDGNIAYLYSYTVAQNGSTTTYTLSAKNPDEYDDYYDEDGNSTITVDLSLSANSLTTIKATYFSWVEWVNNGISTTASGTTKWDWQYGEPNYTLEYYAVAGQMHKGVVSATNYENSNGRLPGGYTWYSRVIDSLGRSTTQLITSVAAPSTPTITWTRENSKNNLKYSIPHSSLYTGYDAIRLLYKRSNSTNWNEVSVDTNTNAFTHEIELSSDFRNFSTTEAIGYSARVIYSDSEIKYKSISYEYEPLNDDGSYLFDIVLAYPIKLVLKKGVSFIEINYVDEYNTYHENVRFTYAGGTINESDETSTHYIHVKNGSYIGYTSYEFEAGYAGLNFDMPLYKETPDLVLSAETYTFSWIKEPQIFTAYIKFGDEIISATFKHLNPDDPTQYITTTLTNPNDGSLKAISTGLGDATFTLVKWVTTNNNLYDPTTLPTPSKYDLLDQPVYDAYNYPQTSPLELTLSKYIIQLNSDAAAITSYAVNLSNANGSLTFDWLTNSSYVEITTANSACNYLKITSVVLNDYHKNVYLKNQKTQEIITPLLNGLYPMVWGQAYYITADKYALPILQCVPDKYTITCELNQIDIDAYGNNQHTVRVIDSNGITVESINTSFSSTTWSHTFGNTSTYPIKADSTYKIEIDLYDQLQSKIYEKAIVKDKIKTLPRKTPKGLYIDSNITNRAYGYVLEYEDYNQVYSYYWNTTKSITEAVAITITNNLTENVRTSPMPSGDQPFDLNSTYYAQIILSATDGSGKTWISGWGTIQTPNEYLITFILNNISSIKAKSDLTNNKDQVFTNGQSLTVTPNTSYTISNVNNYNTLTTPNNRTMTYKAPVFYTASDGRNGTFVNAAGIATPITGTLSVPELTVTLTATPADWVWPAGYAAATTPEGQTPILTAGRPTTDFKHQVWNELMFYLQKWSEYKSLAEAYVYSAMSEGDTTLTAKRYSDALKRLKLLFNALSDVIGEPTARETPLTAKGLQAFGDSIKYDNLKE